LRDTADVIYLSLSRLHVDGSLEICVGEAGGSSNRAISGGWSKPCGGFSRTRWGFSAYVLPQAIGRGGGEYFASADLENVEENIQKCLSAARQSRWYSPVTVRFYSWTGRRDRTRHARTGDNSAHAPLNWQQFNELEMPSKAGTVLRRFANGEKSGGLEGLRWRRIG